MATSKAAKLVSAVELSKMVDKAVAIAAKRHEVAVSETNLILKWELIGRLVKSQALADKFSADVSSQLVEAGIAAQPATLRFGKQILCGFYEKANIPVPRVLF